MRKKLWLSVFLFIGSLVFVYAQNTQTVIPSSSKVYEYLNVILSSQGRVSGILERPASKDRILSELEKIDYDRLTNSVKLLYSKLLEELRSSPIYREKEKLAVDLSPEINLETYFQTESDHIDWLKPNHDRLKFITLPLETWFFNSVYGRVDFQLAKNQFLYDDVPDHDGYWMNVPVNTSQVDFQFPYVAFLAAGGSHWNLQLGRDTLDYGSGRSGNLLISDNVPYYSFFRVKTFWDAFSYSYTAIDLEPWGTVPGSGTFKSVKKFLLSHELVFTFIPRARIGVRESLMQSDFSPSLNYLNPLMILHNYYLDGFNSFLTLNAEINIWKGLNIYGVLAVDQLQTSYEIARYDATAIPNAYGWLLGTEFSIPHSEGYWLGNVEFIYTNPWLYIHESPYASFIWTEQIVSNVLGSKYFEQLPLGYPSGPDSINLLAKLAYTKLQLCSVAGGYSFRLKGSHNIIDTSWSDSEGAAALQTPTGTAETTHSIWLDTSWYPSFYANIKEIGTEVAYIFSQNKNNTTGQNHHDFQWSFHISLSY